MSHLLYFQRIYAIFSVSTLFLAYHLYFVRYLIYFQRIISISIISLLFSAYRLYF